ncbi:WG repeat-containing protein, partial [Bacteroides congonensis]|uniref:WG repeat-containing protein n=1 Tax=Bacteroides congonensis TaxID=1871006 RepID=UPI0026770928
MDKPLFSKYCHALEYKHLFKSHDDMNFYSAREGDNDYIMVDDYDCGNYDVWSEIPIILLEDDRLLCKRNEKYGVVNAEGWTIIPFVYDRFDNREEAEKNRYSVLLGNKWGVIDSSGRELFRIKYNNPIPILKFPRRVSTVSNDVIICRGGILVEDADTHRQGLVSLNGQEVIPTIYSKIEQSGNWDYVFVNWGAIEEPEPYSTLNGVWGCYNWQGKEVIPVKYHAIHCIDDYFIAGDDEYSCDCEDYGTYDLYNMQGTMIMGGFNNCQIGTNYFIFKFGITVKSRWEKSYWDDFEYAESLVKELN